MTHAAAQRGSSRRWWVTAVVCSLIAAACITAGLRGQTTPLAGPTASEPSAPAPAPAAAPSTSGSGSPVQKGAPALPGVPDPVVARSVPVELRIPAIGLAVSLSGLGLNADGTVEVPTDFQEPGWFQLGPSPGQLGSAVILGHVDSYQGPAVFFELRSLRAGDRVEVSLADGGVAHFSVDTVATYPKEQFPAQKVYGSHGYSALQLVTCGGEFDSGTRSYLSNVVAYTSLVEVTPAGAAAPDLTG